MSRLPTVLRGLGAFAIVAVGIVHLQQYSALLSHVPTIGELFLLNGAGAGAVLLLLGTRHAVLGALAGIALSAGSLASIAISLSPHGLFAYREATLRTPVAIAIVAEIAAIALLAAFLSSARLPVRASAS